MDLIHADGDRSACTCGECKQSKWTDKLVKWFRTLIRSRGPRA
jgi:hypothetical protein